MNFIGIAGSRCDQRQKMADQITSAAREMGGGPRRMICHALYDPKPRHATSEKMRAERVRELIEDMVGMKFDGCVFSQVYTESEAEVIRAHGGVIWHLQGQPSDQVMIRKGDQMITLTPGGDRHYADAVEALSLIDLQEQRAHRRERMTA